jgi:hypothetical protein
MSGERGGINRGCYVEGGGGRVLHDQELLLPVGWAKFKAPARASRDGEGVW